MSENNVPMKQQTMTAISDAAFAMLPTTPVPFRGDADAVWAWVRLMLYGGAAIALWKEKPVIARAAGGAAALSLMTSLGLMARGRVLALHEEAQVNREQS